MDMSIKLPQPPDELAVMLVFGKIRRQLNLRALQALKPSGVGTRQAVLLREISILKTASPVQLARLTQTDPAATGRIIQSFIRKDWARRVDDPRDRRSWKVSLTERGARVAARLEGVWRTLAGDFCGHLGPRERKALFRHLSLISNRLETRLGAGKGAS